MNRESPSVCVNDHTGRRFTFGTDESHFRKASREVIQNFVRGSEPVDTSATRSMNSTMRHKVLGLDMFRSVMQRASKRAGSEWRRMDESRQTVGFFGGAEGARTPGLRIANAALCQTELLPHSARGYSFEFRVSSGATTRPLPQARLNRY